MDRGNADSMRRKSLKPDRTVGGSRPLSVGRRMFRLLDRIKRKKGVWWMPWHREAMKDVALCEKLR